MLDCISVIAARLATGILGIAACALPSPCAAQDLALDANSAFFQQLRARPLPDDAAETLRISHLFERARLRGEGLALSQWLDRGRIKALLGEPLAAPATVGEAIAAERAAAEDNYALRRRAIDSQLRIERARQSTGNEVEHTGVVRYLGNSTWQGGYEGRIVWMRLQARSRSAIPIQGFTMELRGGSPEWLLSFWRCEFEGGGALPPGATRFAICRDNLDSPKPAAALQAISAGTLAVPLKVTKVDLPGLRLSDSNDTFPEGATLVPEASRMAGETLAATPCAQLNACAQIAKWEAGRVESERKQSSAYLREQARERAARNTRLMTGGLFAVVVLTVALALFIPLPSERPKGWGADVLAVLAIPAGSIALACEFAIASGSSIVEGWGMLLALGAGVLGGALPLLVLMFFLGLLMLERPHRTRFRLAAFGFGIGTLGLFAGMFAVPFLR